MPLYDQFRAPDVDRFAPWESFHAARPTFLAARLKTVLPPGYYAEPRARLKSNFRLATEYAVRVVERVRRKSRLVAAVEFVSPGNKARREHRRQFLAKCARLLRQGVCVAVVDTVTTRRANMAQRLAKFCGTPEPPFDEPVPRVYAVTFRPSDGKPGLATWAHPLTVGAPLPELPLFLSADTAVPLDLEGSYADTCNLLATA